MSAIPWPGGWAAWMPGLRSNHMPVAAPARVVKRRGFVRIHQGKNFHGSLFFPDLDLPLPLQYRLAMPQPKGAFSFICMDCPRRPFTWHGGCCRWGATESIARMQSPYVQASMVTDQLKLLANAMQAYAWRTKALTSNIANLDTPDYRRMSVTFEETLQDAHNTIDGAESLGEVQPRMKVEDGPPILEDELMEMADTQMRTQLASRALREHFDLLRTGITGTVS